MLPLLLLAALPAADAPPAPPLTWDRVDLIEVNHFHDEHGKLVFDQLILWEWRPAESRYQVRGWHLLKSPHEWPRPAAGVGWRATWWEGEILRQVEAPHCRETWGQVDLELREREELPEKARRPLTPAREPEWIPQAPPDEFEDW